MDDCTVDDYCSLSIDEVPAHPAIDQLTHTNTPTAVTLLLLAECVVPDVSHTLPPAVGGAGTEW